MREWAVQHAKCVRQRTVRQETTKFKAGTLPLNMYCPADSAYPKDKIYLEPPAQYQPAVPPIVDEQEEQEQEVTFAHPEVSEAPEVPEDDVQYDTDSGPDDAVESDNDDDTLTFLRAVTTRSGIAVQVRYFS